MGLEVGSELPAGPLWGLEVPPLAPCRQGCGRPASGGGEGAGSLSLPVCHAAGAWEFLVPRAVRGSLYIRVTGCSREGLGAVNSKMLLQAGWVSGVGRSSPPGARASGTEPH